MKNINSEFDYTDALLLYSIAYCQYHNEKATLGRILLTTDAINRSFPTAQELEDGLSRLIVGGYIEIQKELFSATDIGIRLYDDVNELQNPKLTVFEKIKNLKDRLNIIHIKNISKQFVITDAQVAQAVEEASTIFKEIDRKAKGL